MQAHSIDAASLEEQVRATPDWAQHYRQMSPGHFAGALRSLSLAGVSVFDERLNTRVEQQFHAPPGALVFSFDLCEDTLYLLDGDCANSWVTPEHYREVAVVFDGAFLGERGIDPGLWRQHLLKPLRTGHGRLFAGWLDSVLERPWVDEGALASQVLDDCLFLGEDARCVLDARTLRARSRDRQVVLRATDAWVAAPDEVGNAAELARRCGVSLDQLQHSFAAHAGLSPSRWLRLHRLNAAHRELHAAAPGQTTVAEVAMRWQFWHLGRFAEQYRRFFGVLPSQTLASGGLRGQKL